MDWLDVVDISKSGLAEKGLGLVDKWFYKLQKNCASTAQIFANPNKA